MTLSITPSKTYTSLHLDDLRESIAGVAPSGTAMRLKAGGQVSPMLRLVGGGKKTLDYVCH